MLSPHGVGARLLFRPGWVGVVGEIMQNVVSFMPVGRARPTPGCPYTQPAFDTVALRGFAGAVLLRRRRSLMCEYSPSATAPQ